MYRFYVENREEVLGHSLWINAGTFNFNVEDVPPHFYFLIFLAVPLKLTHLSLHFFFNDTYFPLRISLTNTTGLHFTFFPHRLLHTSWFEIIKTIFLQPRPQA